MRNSLACERRGSRGVTLLETTSALFVLAIGVVSAASVLVSSLRLDVQNRETAAATCAAQAELETIRAQSFSQIVALYDSNTANDPGGAGTAPGNSFWQSSLDKIGKRSSVTATVLLPINGAGEVREDLNMPELGLPADLNGDGVVDSANHAADAIVLPVGVRVTWTGATGQQTYTLATMVHP